MSRSRLTRVLVAIALMVIAPASSKAILPNVVNFVVLQVSFTDFPAGTRFTTAQTQTNFKNIAQLWGADTS